jgi:hypothetical protein
VGPALFSVYPHPARTGQRFPHRENTAPAEARSGHELSTGPFAAWFGEVLFLSCACSTKLENGGRWVCLVLLASRKEWSRIGERNKQKKRWAAAPTMLQARNERWREDRTQNEKRAASSVPDVGLPPLGRANRRGMLDTAAATGERLPRGGVLSWPASRRQHRWKDHLWGARWPGHRWECRPYAPSISHLGWRLKEKLTCGAHTSVSGGN